MKKKKIYMLYYNYNHNFGDILIFLTAKEVFQKKGYEVYYTLAHRPCNEILPEASQFDFLLFPGGGLIERDVFNVIKYFKDDYYMLEIPYGVIGLSVGEFELNEYHSNFSFFLKNSEFFYTRDQFTSDYFNRVSNSNLAMYSGDTVFSYSGFANFNRIKRTHIGLNLRKLPYIDLSGDFNWELINETVKLQNISVLIPDEHNEYIKNNLHSLKLTDEFIRTYEKSTAYEKTQIILSEIARCRIVIATRFHVTLAAAVLGGIIPIPITYCPKCSRLAEQLGIEELAVSIGEIDKIPSKIMLAEEKSNYFINKISSSVEKMKNRNESMFADIFEKLDKNFYKEQ